MTPEKVGKFIKEIRKKNNLTQAELADKYGITYQAVSKWENGINLPDLSLIRQMSKDFNVDIQDILDGKVMPKKNKLKIVIILVTIIILLLLTIGFLFFNKDDSFEFKTLSASCDYFNITGSIAYNKSKSSIYISNINYCGGNDDTEYNKIECILYESNGNKEMRIDKYTYESDKKIKLEEYLKNVRFHIDNYARTCKEYKENTLYLQINATDENDKVTTYRIPLDVTDNCNE